jgi:hypothetical protein
MACDPAIDLDIDVISLGHATLKLLKLYLKRCSAAALSIASSKRRDRRRQPQKPGDRLSPCF